MRVLLIASTYHPVVGGAETYARAVAEGMAARGHDVLVFTDGARVDAPADTVENGVRVVRARDYGALLDRADLVRWEQMQFGLLGELARVADPPPDVVHANGMEAAVLGAIVALDTGAPLVGTFHEQEPERGPLGRGRLRLVYGALPLACVLAGSRFYEHKAAAGGAAERVRLVYHGVDLDRFATADRAAARVRFGVAPDAYVVAFAGRFSPRKGARELVAATDVVRRAVPRLRVLVAGSCNSGSTAYREAMLADIAALGLDDVVSVHEDVTADDVPALFAAADVVAQPSHAEGLGLAMIEAMAAGRPVVTTAIDGVREVVTDGVDGVLVAPGDVGALADAIVDLHRDPAASAAIANRATQTVRTRFTRERMLDETEAAYLAVRSGT